MPKITFKEFLIEAPLPAEWDKSVYKPETSFKKRIEYAKERAARIGGGSSRIAFEIQYEGRPTILKIAKNRKGMAQNEYEANMMINDWYVKDLGIVIPGIDADEENDPPTWIHMEKADKVNVASFRKYFSGLDPAGLERLTKYMIGRLNVSPEEEQEYQEIAENNEAISSYIELIGNYSVEIGDFNRLANWGVYDGRVVIIDIGGSSDIIQKHYS